MSVEDKPRDESDYCPDCKELLEIAAINLTLSGRNVALFVCPVGWRGLKPATKRAVNYVSGFQHLNLCCGT